MPKLRRSWGEKSTIPQWRIRQWGIEFRGNAPFIVFDDADIEMAVKSLPCGGRGAIASKYRNAGQTCVCANRILVQDGVYDAFTKRLAETAGAMKVADGFEPGAVIGPLIDMKAVEKVEAHIAAKTVGVRNTRRHCEEQATKQSGSVRARRLGIASLRSQ